VRGRERDVRDASRTLMTCINGGESGEGVTDAVNLHYTRNERTGLHDQSLRWVSRLRVGRGAASGLRVKCASLLECVARLERARPERSDEAGERRDREEREESRREGDGSRQRLCRG
jgi:hypothetical protein